MEAGVCVASARGEGRVDGIEEEERGGGGKDDDKE